jgi:DNA polymerase-3 subunit epsilon
MERIEEAQVELKAMIENPACDEELLFAEDFYARKFDQKKRGFLSEALLSAREISISESYLGKPEMGVREWYKAQGIQSFFTENFLWNALFALNFWDELLVSETAAIYNPFERAPQDLRGKAFYKRLEMVLEERLKLWSDSATGLQHVLQKLAAHYGEPQDLFSWHPGLGEMLTQFIRASSASAIVHVLRAMAKNHNDRRTGFPDLMIMSTDGPRFIEVKSEGDAVKPRQLSQMRLLQQAGFAVEILRVKWAPNPDQAYVVVDVETTGGQGPYHRVTEIGAVKVVRGQIIDEFQTLLNPGRSIPAFITKLTGISNAMVADAPKFAEVAESFSAFTEGAIFAAHHVRFDYGFIQSEFARIEMPFVRPLFCTCQNARKYFPKIPSYSLKSLTQHFEIDLKTHHRALCDAKAAAEILIKIQEKRWQGHAGNHVSSIEDFSQVTHLDGFGAQPAHKATIHST